MPSTSLTLPADLVTIPGLPDVEPVGLLFRAEPFDGAGWMFEPDYDGLRALLYASPAGCEVRTLQEIRFDGAGELCRRVAEVIGSRQAVLDGVVVSLDARGKPVLRDLLRGRGFLAFAASDLLWLDGRDLRERPLAERKALLGALLPSDTGPLYKIFTLEEYGRALFEAARKLDLAGIVAKRALDGYGPGTVWYRIRNPAHHLSDAASQGVAEARRPAARRPR